MSKSSSIGQTALEYLLLLAIIAIIAIGSFYGFLPDVHQKTTNYFKSVTRVVYGDNASAVNGGWCGIDGRPLNISKPEQCPKNLACSQFEIYRRCACPEPAFGGQHCMDLDPNNAVYKVTDTANGCKVPPPCADCTDVCLAKEPTQCGEYTSGLTTCKNACTKGTPCGQCEGPKPIGGTPCPGAEEKVPQATPWQIVDRCPGNGNDHCKVACEGSNHIDEKKNCVTNKCEGNKPFNSTSCNNLVPTGDSTEWIMVPGPASCNAACQVYCGDDTTPVQDSNGASCKPKNP